MQRFSQLEIRIFLTSYLEISLEIRPGTLLEVGYPTCELGADGYTPTSAGRVISLFYSPSVCD